MKQFLLICLLISTISTFAQNGGQASENNLVKIASLGNNKLKVVNKQTCDALIRLNINSQDSTAMVEANDSIIFSPTVIVSKFKAKVLTACTPSGDMGWVELSKIITSLPVVFKSVKAEQIPNTNQVLVTFETASASNIQQYNIKLSTDAHQWKTVTILLPDNVQPNRIYTAKITLK